MYLLLKLRHCRPVLLQHLRITTVIWYNPADHSRPSLPHYVRELHAFRPARISPNRASL